MNKFILIISFIAIVHPVTAQKKLNKQAIHKAWTSTRQLSSDEWSISLDSAFNDQVVLFIDSLKRLKIDTLGCFAYSHPGFIAADSCKNANIPSTAFVYWKSLGSVFKTKFTNNCRFYSEKIQSSVLLKYFEESFTAMKSEFIMPAIYSATEQKGKIIYKIGLPSHEPSYSIFGMAGNNHKYIRFSESALSDKRGLFFTDNLKSTLFKWFTLIQSDINSNEH